MVKNIIYLNFQDIFKNYFWFLIQQIFLIQKDKIVDNEYLNLFIALPTAMQKTATKEIFTRQEKWHRKLVAQARIVGYGRNWKKSKFEHPCSRNHYWDRCNPHDLPLKYLNEYIRSWLNFAGSSS